MKNTKEITTGAMLLAIYAVVMIIDRQFSFMFTEIITVIAVAVVIIIFGNMFNAKDGLFFSIAILIVTFLFSANPTPLFYIPTGIICGNCYNFMLTKKLRSKTILLVIMTLFVIADYVYMLTISPIYFGYGFKELIDETMETVKVIFSYIQIDAAGISRLVEASAYASIVIGGVMKGFIVHLMSIILFKRFKIQKESFNTKGILVLKPIPAYILFAGFALLPIAYRLDNDRAASICFVISSISMLILAYYGYIFLLMFTRLRTKKNMTFIIILGIMLLFPISIFILSIIGFLYGAGPLKKYLVVNVRGNNEKS